MAALWGVDGLRFAILVPSLLIGVTVRPPCGGNLNGFISREHDPDDSFRKAVGVSYSYCPLFNIWMVFVIITGMFLNDPCRSNRHPNSK